MLEIQHLPSQTMREVKRRRNYLGKVFKHFTYFFTIKLEQKLFSIHLIDGILNYKDIFSNSIFLIKSKERVLKSKNIEKKN